MAAHRYWRLSFFNHFAASANVVGLSEVQLRESIGGSDATGSGTPSASSVYSGSDAANAFDNDTGTLWVSSTDAQFRWLKYDFGNGNDVDIEEVVLTARITYNDQAPLTFSLDYSDDNTTWVTKYIWLKPSDFGDGETRAYNTSSSSYIPKYDGTAKRYWRLYSISSGSLYRSGVEVELRESVSGADVTGSGTPSASDPGSTYPIADAFDDNNSTFWDTYTTTHDYSELVWVQYDFGAGVTKNILEVSWKGRATYVTENPWGIIVLCSANGTDWSWAWYDINAFTYLTAWTDNETRVSANPNPPVSAYSLSVGSGSFALAGTVAGLKATRKLTAVSGSFAETGTAAALKFGREIAAGSGAFALSGSAATLDYGELVDYILAAAGGSFIESGTAAILKTTRKLTTGNGSYAETGIAAALKLGRKMASLGGAFALSGTAAGLRATRLLSVASGAFNETGAAATLIYAIERSLDAGAGAFNLSGTAVGLKVTRILVSDSGAFLKSGTAAGLLRAALLAAQPGAYDLSGAAIDALCTRLLPAGPGAYIFTMPSTTILTRGFLFNTESGTFLISGGVVYFPRPGASKACFIFQKRRDHFRI